MNTQKCFKCNGTGHVLSKFVDAGGAIRGDLEVLHCGLCDGSGKIPIPALHVKKNASKETIEALTEATILAGKQFTNAIAGETPRRGVRKK